jgi:hypothetical protein
MNENWRRNKKQHLSKNPSVQLPLKPPCQNPRPFLSHLLVSRFLLLPLMVRYPWTTLSAVSLRKRENIDEYIIFVTTAPPLITNGSIAPKDPYVTFKSTPESCRSLQRLWQKTSPKSDSGALFGWRFIPDPFKPSPCQLSRHVKSSNSITSSLHFFSPFCFLLSQRSSLCTFNSFKNSSIYLTSRLSRCYRTRRLRRSGRYD